MPQQKHPEDLVRVRNVVRPEGEDIQTFFLTRKRKERFTDANGQPAMREISYDQEVRWDFRNGFFFMYGGKPYTLRPSEEKSYPRYIADHCAKNQVQWILNDMYRKSRRTNAEGTAIHDQNILKNSLLRDKLLESVYVGVDNWFEANDDDFDTLLSKQYGSELDDFGELSPVSRQDVVIGQEVDMSEGAPVDLVPKHAGVKRSDDPEVQGLRDELDINQVPWDPSDSAKRLKEKLVKALG